MKKRYSIKKLYKLQTGPPDEDSPEFDHVQPVVPDNGIFQMVDCWLTNRRGRRHPGYNVSPIPVTVSDFLPPQ